jgi:hypothetical protein
MICKGISDKKRIGTQICGPQTCVLCFFIYLCTQIKTVRYGKGLTGYQMNFLRALCDGLTTDFGSKAILKSYNLGSKSNISRIKTTLQDKEMIDFDKDGVYLEDPVFKIWFKRQMF